MEDAGPPVRVDIVDAEVLAVEVFDRRAHVQRPRVRPSAWASTREGVSSAAEPTAAMVEPVAAAGVVGPAVAGSAVARTAALGVGRTGRRLLAALVGIVLVAGATWALGGGGPWRHPVPGDVRSGGGPRPEVGSPGTEAGGVAGPGARRPDAAAGNAPAESAAVPSPPATATASAAAPPADGLVVRVAASDVRPEAGEEVVFTASWTDGEGMYAGTTRRFGDGTPPAEGAVAVRPCTGTAPSAHGTATYGHAFLRPGPYTVVLTVATRTCDGVAEAQEVALTVVVSVAPVPLPVPTPAVTPTAVGTPAPPPAVG